MAKTIQIQAFSSGMSSIIYVLRDDGSIWRRSTHPILEEKDKNSIHWEKIPDIPDRDKAKVD